MRGDSVKAEAKEFTIESQTMAAAQAIDALLVSTGPSDLCRQIVHAEFVPETTRGFQLFPPFKCGLAA